MEKITLDQLTENLKKWRSDREIDTKSTAEAQRNCYLEELGELKDAIGDSVVCLLNCEGLGADTYDIRDKILDLDCACGFFDFNLDECLAIAWNEIKDRVGLMRDNGKFTKWKDLTHEERLKVIDSGQFDDKPVGFIADHITNDYIEENGANALADAVALRLEKLENGK